MSIKQMLEILFNYQSRSLIIKTFLKIKHIIRKKCSKMIIETIKDDQD